MKKIFLLLTVLMLLLACSKSDLDNPFDPEVDVYSPDDFSIEIIEDTTVRLSWKDAFHNETGYQIDRKTETTNWTTIHTTESGDVHEWLDENVPQYQDVQYRVAVIYDEKVSTFAVSEIVVFYPAPSDLVIEQVNIHRFKIEWMDNCDCEDGFAIERSINGADYEQVALTDPDATEFVDDLDTRAIYNVMYRVRTVVEENFSAFVYGARVLSFPAPTEIDLLQIGLGSLRVSWQNNAEGHQGYKIDKLVDGDWIENYAEVSADETSFDDMNVALNDEVQYRVYAFYNEFISDPVLTDVHTNDLSAPLNFHYTVNSSTSLTIHWDYMYNDLDGFIIERNHNDAGWEEVADLEGFVRSYTDDEFDIFETYSYRAKAKYGDFESDFEVISFMVEESMIYVAGGTFTMGDTWDIGLEDEKPVHDVTISDFWMSATEITFEEYDAYCEDTNQPLVNDNGWGRDQHPVINISWLDAVRYCNWRSEKEGFTPVYEINGLEVTQIINGTGYALPSEAEWEFAAKGGVSGSNTIYSGSDTPIDVAVYDVTQTETVGNKSENELGIYDLSGNVWEWCWDFYDEDTYENDVNSGNTTDPMGPDSGSYRVFRGGAWSHENDAVRVSNRSGLTADYASDSVGFRVIRRRQ